MSKKLLLTFGILFVGVFTLQTKAEDFMYPDNDGIYYSIIDPTNHLVKTKAGEMNDKDTTNPQIVYGNTVSGKNQLIIPETVEYNGNQYKVVEIGDYGFTGDFTSLILPQSLTKIGASSFYKSKITALDIPESVTVISDHAFQECEQLKSIDLHEGLVSIGAFAFYKCSLIVEIEFPTSLEAIGASAFDKCSSLKHISTLNVLPPAVTVNSFKGGSDIIIKVPNQALDAYKNSAWKNIGSIEAIPVPATSVAFDRSAMIVYVGGTHMPLHATAYPASTTDKITLESSDPEIASLDGNLVVGKKAGEAIITAFCGNQKAICNVTVRNLEANSVTVSLPEEHIYVGDKYTFTAKVTPQNVASDITWSTSNPEIASIESGTGVLTAHKAGNIVVYAQCDQQKGAREINIYPVPANSIWLDKTKLELVANSSADISAKVYPENTTDQSLVWKSSNDNVATVNNGKVTALAVGTATVTVYCGPFAYNTCDVNVLPRTADEVILSDTNISLKTSQDQKLSYTVLPETTTDKTVVWSSLNPEVAEVSADGVITALSSGVATIMARCGEASSICTVNVEKSVPEEIVINMPQLTLRHSESMQLTANREVNWKSNNENIASVSEDGFVTATGVGNTVITAFDGEVSSVCAVNVSEMPAKEVNFTETRITTNVGAQYTIIANVLPLTTTNKELVWQTDSPEIVKVENGVVTGIAPGNAIIKAMCGEAYAICNVTVLSPAQKITVDTPELSLNIGEIAGLVAKVEPFDSTDILVQWESSNPKVAEVNSNGIVQAISEGNTTIIASCGDIRTQCSVVVSANGTAGIEEVAKDSEIKSIKISPYVGEVIIESTTNALLKIYTAQGLLVKTVEVSNGIYNVALPSGLYIINESKYLVR